MNTGFDLDLRQLDTLLRPEGIDPSLISAINSYLIGLSDTTGPRRHNGLDFRSIGNAALCDGGCPERHFLRRY